MMRSFTTALQMRKARRRGAMEPLSGQKHQVCSSSSRSEIRNLARSLSINVWGVSGREGSEAVGDGGG